uniref:ribosomal protein S11 n=1 Tax=Dictyotopsis propagulifera TaxID=670095 RepID=UPI002E78ED36|nr:ribosomal protein S11 [Dictyotopsis propagulifera]WBP69956.1 ribosomal protein S11 [Dictyotopsis propagulifera]
MDVKKKAILYLKCTKRNSFCTLVDFSDLKIKFSCSVGIMKNKKNNYLNVKLLAEKFVQKIIILGYNEVSIILLGLGLGRIVILNSIRESNLNLDLIHDYTSGIHNGCRPSKIKRKKHKSKISFKIKKLLNP